MVSASFPSRTHEAVLSFTIEATYGTTGGGGGGGGVLYRDDEGSEACGAMTGGGGGGEIVEVVETMESRR